MSQKPKTFFIADIHFDHFNVIKYSKRPYESVEEMNKSIIENINSSVSKHDSLYILGDLWGKNEENLLKYLNQIKCENLYFINGNHDKVLKNSKSISGRFKGIYDYLEINVHNHETNEHQRICLFHYPILEWNGAFRGSWMLHGHTHGNLTYPESLKDKKIIDVGIDCWNQHPVSFEKLYEVMKSRKNIENQSD